MMATSFWSRDGTPISAAAFEERLFGQLPQFLQNEDELIALWSEPETRKNCWLAERGFSGDALREASAIVNAEKSDVCDVLAYIAFAKAPDMSRPL
jgi:type I restriction enzyme, R subunit